MKSSAHCSHKVKPRLNGSAVGMKKKEQREEDRNEKKFSSVILESHENFPPKERYWKFHGFHELLGVRKALETEIEMRLWWKEGIFSSEEWIKFFQICLQISFTFFYFRATGTDWEIKISCKCIISIIRREKMICEMREKLAANEQNEKYNLLNAKEKCKCIKLENWSDWQNKKKMKKNSKTNLDRKNFRLPCSSHFGLFACTSLCRDCETFSLPFQLLSWDVLSFFFRRSDTSKESPARQRIKFQTFPDTQNPKMITKFSISQLLKLRCRKIICSMRQQHLQFALSLDTVEMCINFTWA